MILRYFIPDQDMSLVIVGDSGSWMKMWCTSALFLLHRWLSIHAKHLFK